MSRSCFLRFAYWAPRKVWLHLRIWLLRRIRCRPGRDKWRSVSVRPAVERGRIQWRRLRRFSPDGRSRWHLARPSPPRRTRTAFPFPICPIIETKQKNEEESVSERVSSLAINTTTVYGIQNYYRCSVVRVATAVAVCWPAGCCAVIVRCWTAAAAPVIASRCCCCASTAVIVRRSGGRFLLLRLVSGGWCCGWWLLITSRRRGSSWCRLRLAVIRRPWRLRLLVGVRLLLLLPVGGALQFSRQFSHAVIAGQPFVVDELSVDHGRYGQQHSEKLVEPKNKSKWTMTNREIGWLEYLHSRFTFFGDL